MGNILQQGLEAVGKPVSGETWDQVAGDVFAFTAIVAYFEVSETGQDLMRAISGRDLGGYQLVPLNEQKLEDLKRAREKGLLTVLEFYSVDLTSLTNWLSQLRDEIAQAVEIAGAAHSKHCDMRML